MQSAPGITPTKYQDPEELGQIIQRLASVGHCSVIKAARILGLHQQTVYSYVKKGYIRTIKYGKGVHITLDEIERFKREGNWDPANHPELVAQGISED